FHPHHHLEHLIWKMKAIGDQRRPQLVTRELLPEIVGMTRKHQMCAVAQMRGQRRAGLHSDSDLLRRGGGVADGNPNAALNAASNKIRSLSPLRRKRDDPDAPSRGVL